MDYLPAFGTKADVSFHKLPDDNLLAFKKSRSAGYVLSHKCRSSAVVDDSRQAETEMAGQMGDEATAARFVPLEDSQEAVTQHEDG